MAESIALGMRLATADELATAAGIEGEISVTEGEWRAVVHDGVTKGGYPLAKLAEAGYSLTKSEDGTKLQLKNKNGVVLSETDAPASGSGVHVGNEAPTDEKADIWLDLDEDSPAIEVDTSNLVPKTGDRGVLAGYNKLSVITVDANGLEVTIDENSPDDMVIFQEEGALTLNFDPKSTVAYVKNIFLLCDPSTTTVNFGDYSYAEGFFKSYVNDLGLAPVNQIVVVNYCMNDTETGGYVPFSLVSNKALM